MKKKRFIIILSLSFLLIIIFIISSPLFTLKSVDVVFLDENNNIIQIKNNKVFNSNEKIENILLSANFKYGSSLFLLNKDNYKNNIENKNAYLKIIDVQSVFPNKLLLKAKERKSLFYISSNEKCFVLDEDFRILEIINTNDKMDNLIEIVIKDKNNNIVSFFNFFAISDKAFEIGQYLNENNNVFKRLNNLNRIIKNFTINFKDFVKFEICEIKESKINLNIYTSTKNLGVLLTLENLIENPDNKLIKLFNALETLLKKEKIKTSYGILKINDSLNCTWHNL